MSRYTTLPVGHNNNRFSFKPSEDPVPDVVLTGARPAVVWLPDVDDWHPAVLHNDVWYVGADAFRSRDEALAIATARARERNGDG